MEPFLIYLLKSSGIIAVFLLFYMLFLKRETFFRTNRIYLLLGLGFSLLLPFVVFTKTIWVEPMPMYQIQVSDGILTAPPIENPVDWTSLLLYGYCAGALFFALRFVIQLFSLKKLIGNGKKTRIGKFIRVETDQKSSPFSFFNYLVYNPNLHTPGELDTIQLHEKIHAQGLHSVDMLVMHLFTIFQWCNPFIWLYRGCLDDNLEYLADTRTIALNTNKSDYQRLLLRTGMGENLYSVATPFFNSSIKKRIVMLNKNRSHRKNSFKYALILPLLAGFVFLFNVKTEAQVKSTDSIQKDTNKYGPVAYDKERSGDFPNYSINSIDSDNTLTITKNMQPQFYIGDPIPLYLVDGKQMSKTEFDKIDHNAIASISVWKGPQAIQKYGDKGKDGVIEITLKKDYLNIPKTNYGDSLKIRSSSLIIHDSIDDNPLVTGTASGVKLNLGNNNPLIILDGKETSKSNFEKLKPEDIKSINVWKGQKAIDRYGDKARDGAIDVNTKSKWRVGVGLNAENSSEEREQGASQQSESTWKVGVGLNHSDPNWNILEYYLQMREMAPSESHFPDIDKALILTNGVSSSKKDLKSINADQIKMIYPITAGDKDAIKKYGDKAKYGVIEINTKGPQKVVIGHFSSGSLTGTAFEYYQQISKDRPSNNQLPDADKALILIDGKPSNKKDLESLDIQKVENFYLKPAEDEATINKYGDKAKYGLIEFITKK